MIKAGMDEEWAWITTFLEVSQKEVGALEVPDCGGWMTQRIVYAS
jgi:hypothetical protein